VGATCENVAVLDFGHIIAAGPTQHVLDNPQVMAAYLGTEELEVDGDG
jgi:ABC-type branched-subunit amino acid transport system ATPase component